MLLRFTSLFFVLVLSFSVAFSQAGKLKQERAQKINPDQLSGYMSFSTAFENAKLNLKKTMSPAVGDTLVFTDYDYFGNNTAPFMVDLYDFDGDNLLNPLMTFMTRRTGSKRAVDFAFGDPSGYVVTPAFDTVPRAYGWGSLRIARGGPLNGQALIVAHGSSTSWFTKFDLSTFTGTPSAKSWGGNFPCIHYSTDGTIWGTNTDLYMYKSVDQGANFNKVDSMSRYFTYTDQNSEIQITGTNDGQILATYAPWAFMGASGILGTVPEDSADYAALLLSTNGGTTWVPSKIGVEGKTGIVKNRPSYGLLFENFGQVQGLVDPTGVVHNVYNGYGAGVVGSDTVYVFPVVYWNSKNKEWVAISNKAVDEDTSYNPSLRPGNGIGQCYPTIATNATGQVIFALYQTTEYAGTPGTSTKNIYPGDGGSASTALYYTDIFGTYSLDGGKTWVAPFPVAANKQQSEAYPRLATMLEQSTANPNQYTAHFVYMYDKVPGTSLFAANNGASANPIIYKTYTFTAVGVNDENSALINNFELKQNYPNPFNPATEINYTLAQNGLTTLKVYDMMGREVSTLVNQAQEKGSYKVKFDASALSSGMYIYTLTSGNFSTSKKMMLVK